jgi:hypothetical protein
LLRGKAGSQAPVTEFRCLNLRSSRGYGSETILNP